MELDKAPQLAIENVSIGHLAALAPETVFPDFKGAQYKLLMKSHKISYWHFGRFKRQGMCYLRHF